MFSNLVASVVHEQHNTSHGWVIRQIVHEYRNHDLQSLNAGYGVPDIYVLSNQSATQYSEVTYIPFGK